jgi:hypothetical protein
MTERRVGTDAGHSSQLSQLACRTIFVEKKEVPSSKASRFLRVLEFRYRFVELARRVRGRIQIVSVGVGLVFGV